MDRERELISYDDICDNEAGEIPKSADSKNASASASDSSSRYTLLVKFKIRL